MVLFDQLPDSAVLLDQDERIIRVNQLAVSQFPFLGETEYGYPFHDMVKEEKREQFFRLFRKLSTESPIIINTSLIMDKREVPVHIRASRTTDGQTIFLLRREDVNQPGCEVHCLRAVILDSQYQNNPCGILLVNKAMEMISFNREFVRIWNIPPEIQKSRDEEASLQSVLSKLKDPDAFLKRVRELYNNPQEVSTEEVELADGRTLYRHSCPIYHREEYLGRVWYFLDITDLRAAQKEVDAQQRFQEAILQHIQDGIIACDSTGKLSLFNRTSHALLGGGDNTLPNRIEELPFLDKKTMQPVPVRENPLRRILDGQTLKNQEMALAGDATLSPRCMRISGQPMYRTNGEPLGGVISLHDITDLNRAKEQLRFMAFHDELTGLANRRLFHDLLQQSLKQAHRTDTQIGVLFLDLDNFKEINDRFGHDHGDLLLKEVANTLRQKLRDSDLICRWGGDEFLVGLLDCDGIEGVMNVAEKLCLQLTGSLGEEAVRAHVTLSMGIALYPIHGNDADQLIRKADMAMYQAKKTGKNRCELFTPTGSQTS